jgi:hypothetical protein
LIFGLPPAHLGFVSTKAAKIQAIVMFAQAEAAFACSVASTAYIISSFA